MKRVLNSIFQVLVFIWAFMTQRAKFRPELVECGWPGSKTQKFLTIGTLRLADEQLFTDSCGKRQTVISCPQKELFRKLLSGESIFVDPYFKWSKERDSDFAFQAWLDAKLKLIETFDPSDESFYPIVAKLPSGGYLLQDGAHRLAIKSLAGQREFEVSLGIWAFSN